MRTAIEILKKHNTDTHANGMTKLYLPETLLAMEEYAQEVVNNLNKTAVIKSSCGHPASELIKDPNEEWFCNKCKRYLTDIAQDVL